MSETTVLERLSDVRGRIAAACLRSGRDPGSVELIAVTKYAPAAAAAELLRGGLVRWAGENRVQDGAKKRAAVEGLLGSGPGPSWRMIGHLQRNKAKAALAVFDAVDTVDRAELGLALQRELEKSGRRLPVLVQADLAGLQGQSGAAPADLGRLLKELRALDRLDVKGLMALMPPLEPVEEVRPFFKTLRRLRDEHFGPDGALSMGMSRDFELAVEEGATLVRVGSSLFGD